MSHFSTVQTELRDRNALIAALRDLGHDPSEGERQVRGYRGQSVLADLAVVPADGGDIGFRWNASRGSYELVTDLELWKQPIPVERFLAKLNQQYALRSILAVAAEEGFQVSEQRQESDGTVELVVTRWND
jgi:hypothetical protein